MYNDNGHSNVTRSVAISKSNQYPRATSNEKLDGEPHWTKDSGTLCKMLLKTKIRIAQVKEQRHNTGDFMHKQYKHIVGSNGTSPC